MENNILSKDHHQIAKRFNVPETHIRPTSALLYAATKGIWCGEMLML
jgi:hypothetical protein